MGVRRPAVLAAVLVVAALGGACSGTERGTEGAERLIEEDWNAAADGDARWPGRPELEGTTAEEVSCPEDADGDRVTCVVRLTSGGPRTEVTVVADLDATGAVTRWRLGG